MKKLLILGGKPIGSVEMLQRAKQRKYYVIVADYLKPEDSPAKRYADESWEVSTADIDTLEKLCIDNKVDGILTAVHEFNINKMIDLCERLNKPCYCNRNTWIYCDNKVAFKKLCIKNDIEVAKQYNIDSIEQIGKISINFPVVTKPEDSSGSRGFSICNNPTELINGFKHALDFSPSKKVIVEDYIPYDSVIIHYTMYHGKCYFSAISDKYSVKFPSTGASVMGLQIFQSKGRDSYLKHVNEKAINMFEKAGFTDGPIWTEAFFDNKDKFIFNEMGYRFGGSLTNNPVQYFYGIDQLELMLDVAMSEEYVRISEVPQLIDKRKKYCILPIHIHAGTIYKVNGIEMVSNRDDVYAIVPVHFKGDVIQDWGSAQQVFCYLHILYNELSELQHSIQEILKSLTVIDTKGVNLLYTLFDINKYYDNNE